MKDEFFMGALVGVLLFALTLGIVGCVTSFITPAYDKQAAGMLIINDIEIQYEGWRCIDGFVQLRKASPRVDTGLSPRQSDWILPLLCEDMP